MRPTYLEVNLTQLQRNLEAIRAHVAPAKVLAVVKANAYGHGVDGVAPFLEPFADYLGVALVEEGIHLRELGITKPILVMGGTLADQLPAFLEHDLTLTASSLDLLLAADRLAESTGKCLRAHLKIDTGMERVGVRDTEAEPFIEKSIACSHLSVEGIYTHLANSEMPDLVHARLQLERFQGVLALYDKLGAPPPICHLCNSGGILQLPEGHLDMVRPGIMLYGYYPGGDVQRTVEIQPALTWRSQVVYSKITPPGRPVSYGSLWQAEAPTRIVTVPCGYADGYFRRMTNQARVVIRGKSYPQVGRICMDQFMVDVGADEVQVGDEVILLGQGISADDLALWAGTNNYEPLTNISARVPRVYVSG
ncbi:MAG: alanine racemase [Chloroflexi bacterium]|nr:alanine racemase [Chloroflexota bacterium]